MISLLAHVLMVGVDGSSSLTQTYSGIQAFYILFSSQIDSPDWPQKLCQNAGVGPQGAECVDARKYTNGTFIASPQNLTSEHVKKIKRDVSGSSVVAYFDFGDLPLANSPECPFCHSHIMGDRPGRNCSTTYHCGASPFLAELQRVFPPRLAVHDITDGTPGVCVEAYPGLAKYVWNNQSAPLLASFLAKWVKTIGLDGIYFDGYLEPDKVNFRQCETKEEGCTSFLKAGRTYDIDGDGVADTPAEIAGSYFAWAPAFVAVVRGALGDGAIILANSAGSVSDPSLSGVTIEMEACTGSRGGARKCADALGAQRMATTAAGHGKQPVSVLWLTHSEAMPAAKQCAEVQALQQQYPWVQAGTDFFDGSHVVC